jgi:hypothetical protein
MQAMITRLVGWKQEHVSVAIKETETRFCFHVWYRTVGGQTVDRSIFLLKIQGVDLFLSHEISSFLHHSFANDE